MSVRNSLFVCAVISSSMVWAQTLSIESVNRDDVGNIKSVDLSFSADVRDAHLYLVSDDSDKGEDWRQWGSLEEVAVIAAGETRFTHEFSRTWNASERVVRYFLLRDVAMPIDRLLEYVEVDGRQAVDTAFKATGHAKIEMDFEPKVLASACLFSCRGDTKVPTYTLFYIENDGWRYDYDYQVGTANTPLQSAGVNCHIVTSNGWAAVNGTAVSNRGISTCNPQKILTIFGLRESEDNKAKGRLRGFKAWSEASDDSTLVLDLVPAVSNGVVGLCNRVDGSFLTDRQGVGLEASEAGEDLVQDKTEALTGYFGAERRVRVASSVRDASGRLSEAVLQFDTGYDRWLWVAYGACTGSPDNPMNWSGLYSLGLIDGSTTSLAYSVPTTWKGQVRFFLTKDYFVPCESLYEYVTVGSANYVETDFVPTRDATVEMKLALTDVNTAQTPFCARGNNTKSDTYTTFYLPAGWRFDLGTVQNTSTIKADRDCPYLVTANGTELTVKDADGNKSTLRANAVAKFTAGGRLALFASHSANTGYGNYFTGRFYSLRAWDDESTPVLDLVPCKYKGRICFYDKVEQAYLYPNAAISESGARAVEQDVVVSARSACVSVKGGLMVIIR